MLRRTLFVSCVVLTFAPFAFSCVADVPAGDTPALPGSDASPADSGAPDSTSLLDTGGDATDSGSSDAPVDACNNACGGCGNFCPDGTHYCVSAQCAKFVFVTDGKVNGNFPGLAGGNAHCTMEAQGHLPGTYVAWLGDMNDGSVGDAFKRFPSPPAVPYVLANGTQVGATLSDIASTRSTTNHLMHPINMTQTKQVVSADVWTGDGQSSSLCNEPTSWASVSGANYGGTGSTTAMDQTWSANTNNYACSALLPLYCFEQ